VTASPFEVAGSAAARPVVTITGSATGDRYRITLSDRTGDGVIGWLQGISWAHPAAESWLWINGVPMPFRVTGGRLWFRADIQAGNPTLVDLYHIAGSSNTRYADALVDAGTTFSAGLAAGTSVAADISSAGQNAVSASLTWQPATTGAHDQQMPYTYGLSDTNQITLIDREASGERQQLGDDADSFVFTSPVEIASSGAFSLTVASGIRLPEADTSENDDWSRSISAQPDRPAYLRLRAALGGSGHVGLSISESYEGEGVDAWTSGIPEGTVPPPYYTAELTFGGSSASILRYTDSFVFDSAGGGHYDLRRDVTLDADSFLEGVQNAVDGLGSVSALGDYDYLITFAGSGTGVALPFMGLSMSNIEWPVIIDQAWVDADGNVITSDETSEPANGRVRAVLRYRKRDDETWYTAWSEVVNGNLAASAQSINVPARSYSGGAVQIAIGLESVANTRNAIDWGVLTVETGPTLTFASGVTPLADVSEAIDAMRITGAVTFENEDGSSYRLALRGVFCDDGLVVDADDPWVEGDGGVGPVYGTPEYSDPDIWVALSPGEVTWATEGDVATVAVAYHERWSV
jgi:hypothetical protein